MARPRSAKVEEVKTKLVARLADVSRRPGTRFLSARAVATLYSISYQTAHRLLAELATEGRLQRRAASGTFRLGTPPRPLVGAQLLFHERAKRPDSFGAHLLDLLRERLTRDRVDHRTTFVGDHAAPRLHGDRLPVLWDTRAGVDRCVATGRAALLINDRPPPGIDSLHIDSVGVDDFSGGAIAGQLLARRAKATKPHFLIVSGPAEDRRNVARVAGCRSVLGDIPVIEAGGWYLQHGVSIAAKTLAKKPTGIFCCNDRLAEAIATAFERARASTNRSLAIVGFDDAPVAESVGLTTIAIPWAELIGHVATVIRRRLAGDVGVATHQVVSPRPVIRWDLGRF